MRYSPIDPEPLETIEGGFRVFNVRTHLKWFLWQKITKVSDKEPNSLDAFFRWSYYMNTDNTWSLFSPKERMDRI